MSSKIESKPDSKPPLAWSNAFFFLLFNLLALTLVPWWGFAHGYGPAAWWCFALLMTLGGMSITAGYHRLWSHRTFKARWPLRLALAIFGAMALQNSVLVWAARHRVHHRHVDQVDRDPHSIRTSFWHAHIGWMLRDWPTSRPDFNQVQDLRKDPIVMWQHRHYWTLVWLTNLGFPILAGLVFGDVLGMLLLAGVFRLVVSHHFTFFINSLAHYWGVQPYSDDHTAVDNGAVALLTWGEGYHNFHHSFPGDYRNGVRWWQFDPGKWFIKLAAWTGLAYGLRRTPGFKIQRSRVAMQFKRLNLREQNLADRLPWRDYLEREYQQFVDTVRQWQSVQARKLDAGREALRDRWLKTQFRTSFKELEYRLKMQRRRLRVLAQSSRLPSTQLEVR